MKLTEIRKLMVHLILATCHRYCDHLARLGAFLRPKVGDDLSWAMFTCYCW